jgi:hypothetical protein
VTAASACFIAALAVANRPPDHPPHQPALSSAGGVSVILVWILLPQHMLSNMQTELIGTRRRRASRQGSID